MHAMHGGNSGTGHGAMHEHGRTAMPDVSTASDMDADMIADMIADMEPDVGAHMSADMGCCPGEADQAPAQNDHAHCPMGFCCVGAMALGDVTAMRVSYLPAEGRPVALPADQVVTSAHASPPFRPPRV